ncbi:hypothetical protein N0V86_003641 [Didymella sp. IMI 355093]|nr:hypothetical protein N0V86_003641 [Didymella sp. IMI 355093]
MNWKRIPPSRTEEPATVGRVAVEVVSGTEAEGLTVADSTEDASAVLEEGAGVASEEDTALDKSSLGVLDAAALEDESVTAAEEDATLDVASLSADDAAVLEDGRIELAGKDDDSTVLLEVGTTTIPVGVMEDSTEENTEVSSEKVGKG